MITSDERLLHDFYSCNAAALDELAERIDPVLAHIAYQILRIRTGSAANALGEWDIDDRLSNVWAHVMRTKMMGLARWPHQRLTALSWLIYLLSLELDRHLGFRPPF